jgi:hypothetical protein
VVDGSAVDPEKAGWLAHRRELELACRRRLTQEGLQVIDAARSSEGVRSEIDSLAEALGQQHRALSSSRKRGEGLRKQLDRLGQITKADLLVMVSLNVHVGNDAWVDPVFSGQVGPTTHSATYRVSLVSLHDGQPVWCREVFQREKPTAERIRQAVALLLPSLPAKKE